jgi:hypothetical protein
MSTNIQRVAEFFLKFLKVDKTIGLEIFDVLMDKLDSLDFYIANARAQGYDNGSNMWVKSKCP